MADEKNVKQAKAAYATLCEMLQDKQWKFKKDDEKFKISCGACGDDLPMDIVIHVDPERLIVSLMSYLPFSVPEEKRVEMALAVSVINYAIVDGSFDYDFTDGTILFRMTSSFRESLISKELFEYILFVSCATIDEYNDKLLMMVKDKMTLEDLVKLINE